LEVIVDEQFQGKTLQPLPIISICARRY
jgi:hypothetical protein